MARSYDQTGVMQVNGAWATRVTYEADVLGPRAGFVELRFMQGRAEVARVSLGADEIAKILGSENGAAIARHIATDADKYLPTVRGELKGRRLRYGEVSLPSIVPELKENSIGLARARDFSDVTDLKATAPPAAASMGDQASAPEREESLSQPPLQGASEKANSKIRKGQVPEHIAAKYLVRDDRYHFDDQTVAFIDKGSRLTVQTHNAAVLKDLVEIAKSRDWQAVSVTGTQSFRRDAWRAAYAEGLSVSGYTPSGVELAAANRERERRAGTHERVEPAARAFGRSPSGPGESAAEKGAARTPSQPDRGIQYGTLVDHGVAPYQHDASNSASYYVTLRDAAGAERTHWGVGLEEAITIAKSQPTIGDRVGLHRVGATAVTVTTRAPGPDGEMLTREVDAKRNQWRIEKEEYLRGNVDAKAEAASPRPTDASRAATNTSSRDASSAAAGGTSLRAREVAAAIRSAETTREELQLKFPEINKAVFQHIAAHEQFAESYVKAGLIRETDRAQVIAQLRERLAVRVEQGKALRELDNKEVATLIRRSVNRVAADIARPAVEVKSLKVEPSITPKPLVREDVQVR